MNYDSFKRGFIKNPYDPIVCGVGFLGEEYAKDKKEQIKTTKSYKIWHGMITRCYDTSNNGNNKKRAYSDCKVCDEWLNYSNFKKWFDKNYYEIPNCTMNLDKDIKIVGNRIYSPNSCIFISNDINTLFVSHCKQKYFELPTGVILRRGKYSAHYMFNDKRIIVNGFDTIEEAENEYINGLLRNLKNKLLKYKEYIPTKVYNIINEYDIEKYKLFLNEANKREQKKKYRSG
jgi:hypothetical protein